MTIRVVLGDDNVLVREGVRALLSTIDGIEVVGVAEDAPSLLAAAAHHEPDVVVTDIKMPPNFQLEGIECAHTIRERHPGTGVVVLSAHDDEAYALALLGGGQSGLAYLLKDRLGQGDELPRAIREVAAGGSLVDPTIAARLSGHSDRTEDDRRILDMMAEGHGYADMAEALGTIDQFAGDALMAVFGAPDPLPDHAARALRCALAMQARQRELNAQAEAQGLPPWGMGIGVNTGSVVAGTLGGAGRFEYTVLGDAVNVASRLQGVAAAGEVLATASTLEAAG